MILEPIASLAKGPAFSAAGKAMGEVISAGCIGTACVKTEYLTPEMVQNLSKTTFSILLPMFLFSSITKSIQQYGLTGNVLSIPFLAIAHAFTLYLISKHLLMPMFGMSGDTDENRGTLISASFGNAGVLPLIFAEALFRNCDPSLISKANSQISFYLLGWSPFFWSFGRKVLVDSPTAFKQQKKETFSTLRGLFPPPVVGVVSGVAISLLPPCLKKVLLSNPDHKAPLDIVYQIIKKFGTAANPLSLLVLTASLALNSSTSESRASFVESGDRHGVSFLSRYICVSIARFIVSPVLMYCMMAVLNQIGAIESSKSAPMLWFILLLQSSMPSAQNSVLMLQAAEKGGVANSLARFLFSIYATAMIPLVVLSTLLLRNYELISI